MTRNEKIKTLEGYKRVLKYLKEEEKERQEYEKQKPKVKVLTYNYYGKNLKVS